MVTTSFQNTEPSLVGYEPYTKTSILCHAHV